MQLSTKYFGFIDIAQTDVIHFPYGLFGFEEETQFLLLPFEDNGDALYCLQSFNTPELAFIVMNPFALTQQYKPSLQPDELTTMDVSFSEELCFYVLCIVKHPIAESTVNLKCPVVINEQTGKAMQVILDTQTYQMRHLLSEFQRTEEGKLC